MDGKNLIEQFQIKDEYGIDYFHLHFHYLNMKPQAHVYTIHSRWLLGWGW
jgi:hypothetical protein